MIAKRTIALFMALLFAVGTLSSCRFNDSGELPEDTSSVQAEEPEEFEEQTVFKGDGISVTATSLTEDKDSLCVGLDINNSTFTYISVSITFLSADGVMVPFESEGLAEANRNGTGKITIKKSDLEKLGISSIAELSFTVGIIDTNTYAPVTDKCDVKLKLPAEAKRNKSDVVGALVYDKSRVRITVIKILYNEEKDTLDFLTYIENNTSKNLNIGSSKFLINGEENRFPRLSCDVASKKVAYHTLSVPFDSLREIGISNISFVDQITFDLIGNDSSMENVFRTGDMTVDFE